MKAEVGPVSEGTMRNEDLIPEFVDLLELMDGITENHKTLVAEVNSRMVDESGDFREDYFDYEEADCDLTDLMAALDTYSPPYCYFGASEGDGACYGWWLYDDIAREVQDAGGIVVSDLSEVPQRYVGEVLVVNDHGNASLYAHGEDGEDEEIWAVV